MNIKKIIILGILIIIFMILVVNASFLINTFTPESLERENLTFTLAGSIYRDISISSEANLTVATIDLKGYGYNYKENQETYDELDCSDSNWEDCGRCFDGDWTNTYCNALPAQTAYAYFNYTKLDDATNNSKLRVRHGSCSFTITEVSIPASCWNGYSNKLVFRLTGGTGSADIHCDNTTSWVMTSDGGGNIGFCEERMVWNISKHPENLTIKTNNSITYQNLSTFNGSVNNIDLNITLLQSCVDLCLNPSGNDCLCEINFTLVTAGILEYSDINITWDDIVPPTFSNNKTNSSSTNPKNNGIIQLNLTLTDGVNVSKYLFSWNESGNWVNDSITDISDITDYTVSENKTISTQVKNGVVGWRIYGNDSSGNVNASDVYTFTVKNSAPTITSISDGTDPIEEETTQTITPSGQADADSDGLFIYCCQDTGNTCTPDTGDTCNNNQEWSSPYGSMTCTLTTPNVASTTTYYSRCNLYDGAEYSSTVSTSYSVFECNTNSDCAGGEYCQETTQVCTSKKAHGSTCDLSNLENDADGVDSICTDGDCNAGFCNTIAVMQDVNITSLGGSNRSNETLQVTYSFTDVNSDSETANNTRWFNNSVYYSQFDNWTDNLTSTYLKKGDNWSVSVQVFDGYNWSAWKNSTNLTILNTPPATPTLISPADLSAVATDYAVLKTNCTDLDNWTDTITFYYYNSTDDSTFSLLFNGSGFGNSSYNWTNLKDDDYYWKTKCGDGEENSSNTTSFKFTISTVSPAITLNYPPANKYFNTNNISYFNFTAIDPDDLGTCNLWHNINGNWIKNQTTDSAASGVKFSFNFTQNITDQATYKWNINCSDTTGNYGFASDNSTFHIDTLKPNVNLTSPTAITYTSLSILLSHTESDFSLSSCQYDFTIGGATSSNITVVCNADQTIEFSALGDYVFNYYVLDLAGNINHTQVNFTITSPPSAPPTGGGAVTPPEEELERCINASWGISSLGRRSRIDTILKFNAVKPKKVSMVFVNTGFENLSLNIQCKDVNNSICQNISLTTELLLEPSPFLAKEIEMLIHTPNSTAFDEKFVYNIVADDEECFEVLNIFAKAPSRYSPTNRFFKIGQMEISVTLFSILSGLLIGVITFIIFMVFKQALFAWWFGFVSFIVVGGILYLIL